MEIHVSAKQNLLSRLEQSSLTVMFKGELHTIYMDKKDNCNLYMIDHSKEGNIGYGVTAEDIVVQLLHKGMFVV